MGRSVPPAGGGLVADRVDAALAGADPHHLADGQYEQQPVAGLAGVRGGDDGLDGALGELRGYDTLDLQLGQQADVGLRAPVVLGVALLAPAALHLGDVEPADPDLVERVLHGLQPFVADDRLDLVDLKVRQCAPLPLARDSNNWRPRSLAPASATGGLPSGSWGALRSSQTHRRGAGGGPTRRRGRLVILVAGHRHELLGVAPHA